MIGSERLPRESGKAYEAFLQFCVLSHGRSLAEVARKLVKSPCLIQRWSSQWNWQQRVVSYDCAQAEIQLAADMAAAKDRAKKMAIRRNAMEDDAFNTYGLLNQKVQLMLQWPLAKEVSQGEDGTIIVMPVNWRLSDVARLIQARDLVRKVALGEPLTPREVAGLDNSAAMGASGGTPGVIIQIEGGPTEPDERIPLPEDATKLRGMM